MTLASAGVVKNIRNVACTDFKHSIPIHKPTMGIIKWEDIRAKSFYVIDDVTGMHNQKIGNTLRIFLDLVFEVSAT